MDPEVMYFFDNTLCGDISTPVTGQLALDLMVIPPQPGEPSYDTYIQVRKQKNPAFLFLFFLITILTVTCSVHKGDSRHPGNSVPKCSTGSRPSKQTTRGELSASNGRDLPFSPSALTMWDKRAGQGGKCSNKSM